MEKNEIQHPGLWYANCDKNGKITSVEFSPSFREVLGYSSEQEFSNTHAQWLRNVHPDDKDRVLDLEDDVFSIHSEGKEYDVEYRLLTKNGYRWVHDYAHIIRDSNGVPEKVRGLVFDIDEQKRTTEALKVALKDNKKQSKLLKQALDNVNEHFAILVSMSSIYYSMHLIDLENDTVTEFNARDEVKEIVNRKKGATQMMVDIMETTTVPEYKKSCLRFTDLTTVAKRMQGKKIITGEFIGKRIGWFIAQFIAIDVDENGKPLKVVFTTQSIDEEKQKELNLIEKSRTDELTGFLNRRAYEEGIEIHNNKVTEKDFVYISFDVNELKVTNDTLGHKAGDELLIGACECMRKCISPFGKVFRTGGDEFAAIIFADEKKLKRILQDFDSTVEDWIGISVKKLSVSYGVVTAREKPDLSVREISVLADKRMYEAKSVYYRKSGTDRRGQKDSHIALCLLYTKILKINVTEDTYQIVDMIQDEQSEDKGFTDKISTWLSSFGKSGQVHPDDLEEYLTKTNLHHISNFFKSGNQLLRLFYKRKFGNTYKKAMMEIIPANDYSDMNQNLFLYVKDID